MIQAVFIALILCLIEIFVIVVASPMAKSSVVLRFLPADVREADSGDFYAIQIRKACSEILGWIDRISHKHS